MEIIEEGLEGPNIDRLSRVPVVDIVDVCVSTSHSLFFFFFCSGHVLHRWSLMPIVPLVANWVFVLFPIAEAWSITFVPLRLSVAALKSALGSVSAVWAADL